MAKFDLIIFETYKYNGKLRHRPFKVGRAVPSKKGGYILFLPEGLSVTGRVMMVPEKTELSEIDLLDAYQSATDEYGL